MCNCISARLDNSIEDHWQLRIKIPHSVKLDNFHWAAHQLEGFSASGGSHYFFLKAFSGGFSLWDEASISCREVWRQDSPISMRCRVCTNYYINSVLNMHSQLLLSDSTSVFGCRWLFCRGIGFRCESVSKVAGISNEAN